MAALAANGVSEVDETIQAPEPRQPKKKAAAPKAEKPATEEAAE